MGYIGEIQIGLIRGGSKEWIRLDMFDSAHFKNIFGYLMSQLSKPPKKLKKEI